MHQFFTSFWNQLLDTPWYEYMAVVTGIISVWYSKKENVLVYPFGLISTSIYIVLSFQKELIGEASVNFYYTIMSLVGWYLWLQKKPQDNTALMEVTFSKIQEILFQSGFFIVIFILLFSLLTYLQSAFYPGVIPLADGFATATAFTGMYLMIKKKVESWYWWIATNIASIPLYYVKGLVVTSVYYCILLLLAIFGLLEWRKKAKLIEQKKATFKEESSFHIERYF